MARRRGTPGPGQMTFDLGGKKTPPAPTTEQTPSTLGLRGGAGETGAARRVFTYEEPEPFDISRAEILIPAPQTGGRSGRPRVRKSAYDPVARTMHVQFRDGTEWEYYDVDPRTWAGYRRRKSSHEWVEQRGNTHPYAEAPEYVWNE